MVAVVSLVELMRKETNLLGIKFKSCGLRLAQVLTANDILELCGGSVTKDSEDRWNFANPKDGTNL